ncbi:MAG: hypothetical protein JXA21_17740 [Anaerolineae bacterium]|nr:hypothetical protein [Anaerolineae bacterium]
MHILRKILFLVGVIVTLSACGQVRQLEAEAALMQAEAARNQALADAQQAQAAASQAQADLVRAEGEMEILKAAAGSVEADRQWSHVLALSGVGSVLAVLVMGMFTLVTFRRGGPTLSARVLAAPLHDLRHWQAEAQRWQAIALFLASVLRRHALRLSLTVAERRALALVEQERHPLQVMEWK